MKIGFCLPQMGAHVDAESIQAVAEKAEALGYAALWVQERLIRPLKPRAPYPMGDGTIPPQYSNVMDPIATLTIAAAVTSRIKLGTSVIVYAYHSPVDMAKRIASLDVLSGGRVIFGIGLGWNVDEYVVSGLPYKHTGQRMDEYIACVKALWRADPVEFDGQFYQVPSSEFGPKPVQKPHPPILVAAFTPPGLKRAVALGDGWHPIAVIPWDQMAQGIQAVKARAKEAGKDPDKMEIPARCFPVVTPEAQGRDRQPFVGSMRQIKEDARKAAEVGITELVIETNFLPDVKGKEDHLRYVEMLREMA